MDHKRLSHVIHQLRGKSFSKDLMVEIKMAPQSVSDALIFGIESDEFTPNQVIHTLHILFDLCSRELSGQQNKLFSLCLKCSESEDVFVASESLMLMVRMAITNKLSEAYYPLDIKLKEKAFSIFYSPKKGRFDRKAIEYMETCCNRYSICELDELASGGG